MKKLFFITVAGFALFTACHKEKECKCKGIGDWAGEEEIYTVEEKCWELNTKDEDGNGMECEKK